MNLSFFKSILLGLLTLVLLLLILAFGVRPWLYNELSSDRLENYKKLLIASSSTLELGALSGDAFFLEEPLSRLMRQTSADYLVVYNLKGKIIATKSEETTAPETPLTDKMLQTLKKDINPLMNREGRKTDYYIPIWYQLPVESSLDESQVFFPKAETTTTEETKEYARNLIGVLRMGMTLPSSYPLPLPEGLNKIYLIVSLSVSLFLLTLLFWWGLYRRLQPIQRGVNLLSRGNDSYTIPPLRASELNALGEGINISSKRMEQLRRKIDELSSDLTLAEKQGWTMEMVKRMSEELSSPSGFLFMNLYRLLEYITGLLKVLNAYNNIKLNSHDAQNLEELKQDTEYDHIIEDIERLVRSAIKAIDKIKQISTDLKKLSSSELPTSIKKTSINKIVTSALERVRSKFDNRIEVETFLSEIHDDSYPLRTLVPVFVNIIENAMESITDKGKVQIKTRQGDDTLFVEIMDTGSGINQERLERIFEPFYTTKEDRLGLGLSICREILDHFNGTISAESTLGQGTIIRVSLPLRYQNEPVTMSQTRELIS